MRLTGYILVFTACLLWYVESCEPNQTQNGCKIYGSECLCGFGCKTEYVYRTRRACLSALRERSTNICYRQPCVRGICIQTVQEPGFACKCEGTGYYGQRCEKACPTIPVRGCALDEIHYGCMIKESVCSCGYGCKNKYKYRTRRICLSALRSNRPGVCYKFCVRGVCFPTKGGYVCNCVGTKHYGERCEKACPENEGNTENIPIECKS